MQIFAAQGGLFLGWHASAHWSSARGKFVVAPLELANLLIVTTFIAERSMSRIAIPRNVSQTGNPKSTATTKTVAATQMTKSQTVRKLSLRMQQMPSPKSSKNDSKLLAALPGNSGCRRTQERLTTGLAKLCIWKRALATMAAEDLGCRSLVDQDNW